MEINLQGKNGSYKFNPRDPQSRIADGGMGVVYLGENVETGQKVAIKVIYRELAQDEKNIERARREAAINIDHPNLIKMFDFIEKDGIYHIISEYVEGQNLEDFIKQNPDINTEYAIRIINDVLNGLQVLHNQTPPIIHRDIKPSNIFLCYDGTVKLMDFGIARITGGERKSLTGMGTVVGSPHYSPPEQVRGEIDKINETTDIYAVGITLYELLTGNPPFDATNEFDILKKQVDELIPFNSKIPPPLFNIVKKATHKQQESRYQRIEQLKSYLKNSIEKNDVNSITNKPSNGSKHTRSFIYKTFFLFLKIIRILILVGFFSLIATLIFTHLSYLYLYSQGDSLYNDGKYLKAKEYYTKADDFTQEYPVIPWKFEYIKDRIEKCNIQELLENGFIDKRDEQHYNVVKIGDQIWMAENLNYYTKDSWCYNFNEKNCETYGRLYNWEAAKKACPYGWHIPTEKEWNILFGYVDRRYGYDDYAHKNLHGKLNAGYYLKSKHGWANNGNGIDAYGFNALPGGERSAQVRGHFFKGYSAIFWQVPFDPSQRKYTVSLNSGGGSISRTTGDGIKDFGFSLRCIKDKEESVFHQEL